MLTMVYQCLVSKFVDTDIILITLLNNSGAYAILIRNWLYFLDNHTCACHFWQYFGILIKSYIFV